MILVAEKTRVQVEQLVKADPSLSAEQIAGIIGVSRQRVSWILKELGYSLKWVKGEKGPK